MKKILTVGVFDYFHYGHLKLFENAKKLGDYLIVAVQEDEYILKFKPEAKLLYNTQQRVEMVKAIKYVDEVITYKNVFETVREIDFDVFAIGGDQNHEWFIKAREYCIEKGREVILLPRTKGICSSDIKKNI